MKSLTRTWRGETRTISTLLSPLAWLYGAGAHLHRSWRASSATRAELPIISVGNLVVGGAGKTPITLELARRLMRVGLRVAVLSRGYGRSSRALVRVTRETSAREGGDEPAWLARKEPELIVIATANRLEGARVAKTLGADVALLDDGFSHHRLARDEDVLVVDASLGFGNRRLLPAGPLREPVTQAKRATMAWLSRCEGDIDSPPTEIAGMPLVRSRYVPSRLVAIDLSPREEFETLRDMRVVAVSGIARPDEFVRTLERLGAKVDHHRAFGDHHRFTKAEVEMIERDDAELFVTTEKDAMRLAPFVTFDRWRALAMEVEIVGDTSALDALVARFVRTKDAA